MAGIRILGGVLCLLVLGGGCATPPLPGATGEVSGPLRGIDLYMKRPEPNERYRTMGRDRLFASDRQVWVYLHWGLPGLGSHETKVALRTPTGSLHKEIAFRFEAKEAVWATWHPFALPQGEDAQRLTGRWQVEAALDGTAVGRRAFTFDPSNIRLRTEARVVIVQGAYDPEVATGDRMWRNRFAALENVKAAHTMLGVVLRDELARRLPHVDGPQQQPPAAPSDATVLLRTKFGVSPNPSADSELVLEAVHVGTQTTRTFRFRSSAGKTGSATASNTYQHVAATDVAFQAATSPELLDFLIAATKAVPE
jgi:hypothetical protein